MTMNMKLQALPLTRSCVPATGHAQAYTPVPTQGFAERLIAGAVAFFNLLIEWQARENQRRHLMTLDDRLLRDVGISRADAEREFAKPFWQA